MRREHATGRVSRAGRPRSLARLMGMLVASLLAVASAAAVSAQDRPGRDEDRQARPEIESVRGDRYRMASARMADSVTRFADPANDQAGPDGTAVAEAPGWSDIRSVYVAATRMPAKLRTKMASQYPPGTGGSFYGDDYALRPRDRVVFVAVEMGGRLPAGSGGQQVEVGFSGNEATPSQAGTAGDTLAGVETFTLSGLFSNGAYDSGTTDVSGREPGTTLAGDDYYNAEAGSVGFYSPSRSTWYVVLPRAGDANSISVAAHSTTADGQVLDRLDLPSGGHFVDLLDPTGGFTATGSLTPLTCRSLETFSAGNGVLEPSEPEATVVRYTAGIAGQGSGDAAELLASAIEATGPIDLLVTPADGESEPLAVQGDLAATPAGNAVSLAFEVPAGQWTFALADDLELTTPAGERIVDHQSLTGTAGVRTGPGLDGIVAGDPTCFSGSSDGADPPPESQDPAAEPEAEGSAE